jgi:hypothetical protein
VSEFPWHHSIPSDYNSAASRVSRNCSPFIKKKSSL